MWTPIVNAAAPVGMTVAQIDDFIGQMAFNKWRASGMVLHNTALPTLAMWHEYPGATRMANLTNDFKSIRGWSAGPHAFVADDLIWPFTPFNAPGVHSPSWNGTKIGIEMVGDFAKEDATTGAGLKVMQNTAALFGILHARLGLDPDTIKFHKEDPLTTHDCPGAHIIKAEFIARVKEYMGSGGDLSHDYHSETLGQPGLKIGTTNTADLNVRPGAGVRFAAGASLPKGTPVTIAGSAMNGTTEWLRITAPVAGWVAAHFVDQKP